VDKGWRVSVRRSAAEPARRREEAARESCACTLCIICAKFNNFVKTEQMKGSRDGTSGFKGIMMGRSFVPG
jgi:hypothetical protein